MSKELIARRRSCYSDSHMDIKGLKAVTSRSLSLMQSAGVCITRITLMLFSRYKVNTHLQAQIFPCKQREQQETCLLFMVLIIVFFFSDHQTADFDVDG